MDRGEYKAIRYHTPLQISSVEETFSSQIFLDMSSKIGEPKSADEFMFNKILKYHLF